MSKHYYNFTEVIERVPAHIEAICETLFPEGKKKGRNWCVADETGAKGQSFQISLNPSSAGCFQDRADPSIKGNPIALVARRQNLNYQDAGEWLAKFCGVQPETKIVKFKKRKLPDVSKYSKELEDLTKACLNYGKSRGIDQETLDLLNCKSYGAYIALPHIDTEGRLVLLKFWPTNGSKEMWTNPEPIHTLFGKELINPVASGGSLIITEGQWDALTWIQHGYPAVSIPSGANNDQWIEEDWTFLNQFSEIILDFDKDEEGRDAETRVRNRLGYERCRCLRYDFKDANEALNLSGFDALKTSLEEAMSAPVEHIINAAEIKHTVREGLQHTRTRTGVPFFLSGMNHFEFRPHESTLWFGHTGHGKSTAIMNQFAFQAGMNIPGLIASFEDNSAINYGHLMLQYSCDCSVAEHDYFDKCYDDLTSQVHLFDSMKRTEPDVMIATMTLAHKQLGICHFAVDNVMTLDVDRQDNTAQAAVADKFRVFVSRYPVHLHIAAHPRKGPDNFIKPPQISEVRGASEWGDMTQNAICVYRDIKKAEQISELYDEGIEVHKIMEFRRSCRDGKFIVRKQRKTGELPVCSYNFDSQRKRFFRQNEELHPYWTEENKQLDEKENHELKEYVTVSASSNDEPQPLPF
jgi:twinkle protein